MKCWCGDHAEVGDLCLRHNWWTHIAFQSAEPDDEHEHQPEYEYAQQ